MKRSGSESDPHPKRARFDEEFARQLHTVQADMAVAKARLDVALRQEAEARMARQAALTRLRNYESQVFEAMAQRLPKGAELVFVDPGEPHKVDTGSEAVERFVKYNLVGGDIHEWYVVTVGAVQFVLLGQLLPTVGQLLHLWASTVGVEKLGIASLREIKVDLTLGEIIGSDLATVDVMPLTWDKKVVPGTVYTPLNDVPPAKQTARKNCFDYVSDGIPCSAEPCYRCRNPMCLCFNAEAMLGMPDPTVSPAYSPTDPWS